MSATLLLNISDVNNRWNKMALKESRRESDLAPAANAEKTVTNDQLDSADAAATSKKLQAK
jgi:hypothetical protein